MNNNLFPLIAALVSNLIAQLSKPFFYYIKNKQWKWHMILESGGFPSSHTSTVVGLALGCGFVDNFNSTTFSIALILALVVCYDAANVRYYSGQNIQVTKQLIKDIEILMNLKLDDPIYQTKLKGVLGHKWIEVFGGIIWGLVSTSILYILLF